MSHKTFCEISQNFCETFCEISTTTTKRQKFATNKTNIGVDLRIVRDINTWSRVLAAVIAFVGEGFAIFSEGHCESRE